MIYSIFLITFGVYLGQEFVIIPRVKDMFIEYVYEYILKYHKK
jgi:hypothetical protein